jgi:hypothetical protein
MRFSSDPQSRPFLIWFVFYPNSSILEAERKSFHQFFFYQKSSDFAVAANEILNFKNDTRSGSSLIDDGIQAVTCSTQSGSRMLYAFGVGSQCVGLGGAGS